MNYNNTLFKILNKFNSNDLSNDIILEKYYHYTCQLFYSFNEMLKLNKDPLIQQINNTIENYVYQHTLKFLDIFKRKNIYYIKSLSMIFQLSIPYSEIFYRILLYLIVNFNTIGNYYLENRQKYSRYYSRLYFTESIQLFENFFLGKEGIINQEEIFSPAEKEMKKSCQILKELESGALAVIDLTKKNGQLFDPQSFISSMSHNSYKNIKLGVGSGFSLQRNKFLQEAIESYYIILDEFEKTVASLENTMQGSIYKNSDKIEEERAICMGSIAKINFELLGRKNYKECEKLLENCKVIASTINKDDEDECPWYGQCVKLLEKVKEKIEEENKKIDDEWNKKNKPELDKIRITLNDLYKNDPMEFIKYILKKYPKDYCENNRPSNICWDECNLDLIEYLRSNYNLDHCPKNTLQDRFNKNIYQMIYEKLNDLYNILNQ